MKKSSDKVAFFVHIPKAAGRTLIEIIKNEYPSDELFSNSKAVKNNLPDDWKNVDVLERWRVAENAFINMSDEKKTGSGLFSGICFSVGINTWIEIIHM